MRNYKTSLTLLSASLCLGLFALPVHASPEDDAAIQLYKQGKYGPALAAFEAIDKRTPRKPLTHYYIALCCQSLNQVGRATAEYKWVADNSPKGTLKAAALKGLDSVSRYKQGREQQVAASAANTEAAAAADAAKTAAASEKTASGTKPGEKPPTAKPDESKVKKVLAFSTSYDRTWLAFEPGFNQAKEKYSGKIAISQVDTDDEASNALKEKYKLSSFPAFVYLDGAGNVLKTESGCPGDGDAFINEIENLNKKKR